jgi:hypothetical protein
MRHRHELGQCRTAQYCMVRRFEVSHFEFDELSTIVLPRAERDWEDYRTERMCHVTWDDAVEGGLARNQHVLEIQAHFL